MTTLTTPTTSPTTDRPARRWPRRLRRAAAILLATIVALAALGAGIQAWATARDAATHPAPGTLVSVDGHDLHLHVTGEEHADAGPTIVLESGMGPAFSSAWAHVQDRLDDHARVVSYDRPGLGWSDPHAHGRDPEALAIDLRAALDQLDVDGPYLLVAHSLGAFHARVFAATHPDEVAGLVLVDPSHEEQWSRLPQEVLDGQGPYNAMLRSLPVLARVGLTRAIDPFGPLVGDLPEDVQAPAASRLHRPDMLATTWEERRRFDDMGAVAAAIASDLGDLPVRYISSGIEPAMPAIVEPRQQLQREQAATISSDTIFEVIDAGHIELVSQAEPARQVAGVVTDLWEDLSGR